MRFFVSRYPNITQRALLCGVVSRLRIFRNGYFDHRRSRWPTGTKVVHRQLGGFIAEAVFVVIMPNPGGHELAAAHAPVFAHAQSGIALEQVDKRIG